MLFYPLAIFFYLYLLVIILQLQVSNLFISASVCAFFFFWLLFSFSFFLCRHIFQFHALFSAPLAVVSVVSKGLKLAPEMRWTAQLKGLFYTRVKYKTQRWTSLEHEAAAIKMAPTLQRFSSKADHASEVVVITAYGESLL